MRKYAYLFCMLLFGLGRLTAQDNDYEFAKQEFASENYQKALFYYQKLVKKYPRQINYFKGLVQCHVRLEDYDAAKKLLGPKLKNNRYQPELFVLMGNIYTLQKDSVRAKENYEAVFPYIDQNPSFAYVLGDQFKKLSLLDYAIRVYEKGSSLSEKIDFSIPLAALYGEKGNQDRMIASILDAMSANPSRKYQALRLLRGYITDDKENNSNMLLRKHLLQRLQQNPDPMWNDLLSWLFVQQKQYRAAFLQERSIYLREEGFGLHRIFDLAKTAKEQKDYSSAKNIYYFLTEEEKDLGKRLQAHLALLELRQITEVNLKKETIKKQYEELLQNYGRSQKTLDLQIAYAEYVGFQKNLVKDAIDFLKTSLKQPLNRFQQAKVKLSLADLMVFDKQFNYALIYYSQIQKSLKNHVLGQQARFKVAQTSYYKGDFEWALNQLKVLRNSSTQLIANDAMELSLLISDNIQKDSLHTALKKYAKADYLFYQKKYSQVTQLLEEILQHHKGEEIEDETFFKQAEVYQKLGEFQKAKNNYLKIVNFYPESILADNAYYALGVLWEEELSDLEKAQEYYEKILFQHQDSIYYLDARKRYRKLRGDTIY
ncbi:MAG: tetratricopeptide repeat protein [Flavobacteriaceae bacterium]|nr:tetratricopeptide repeat protein [Flavobacteriaceae bacterium]